METASAEAPAAAAQATVAARRARVAELYAEGLGTPTIARRFGVDPKTIWKDLVALGIPRRPPGGRARYPDPGEVVCAREACAAVFRPKPSIVARGHGVYCSNRCRTIANPAPFLPAAPHHLDPGTRVCARDGCRNPFRPTPAQAARGDGRYCSHACANATTSAARRQAGAFVPCSNASCGAAVWVWSSRLQRHTHHFCGTTCRSRWVWRHGSEKLIRPWWRASTVRHWKRVWGGQLGGRPRLRETLSDFDVRAGEVVRLHRSNPKLGQRELARRTGLSRRQVRGILGHTPVDRRSAPLTSS